MIKHAKASTAETFLVATEVGLLHRLQKELPTKTYIAADERAVCRYMKQITLPKLRDGLREMRTEVQVGASIARRARRAIERMVAIH